jgi:hypothetical protein
MSSFNVNPSALTLRGLVTATGPSCRFRWLGEIRRPDASAGGTNRLNGKPAGKGNEALSISTI